MGYHAQRFPMIVRKNRPARPAPRRSSRPAPKVRPERAGTLWVELISIGRELLRGKIADGNAQRLARLLTQRGASVRRITVVEDSVAGISAALVEALGRGPQLVVTTGGLGPAEDDRTLEGLGSALNLPLVLDAQRKAAVEAGYARLERRHVVHAGGLTAAREKLCRVPVGAKTIENPLGVAPGVVLRLPGGASVLALPGMPEEMRAVLEAALPALDLDLAAETAEREVESPTADEAALEPLLERLSEEFPAVWIHSRPAGSRRTGARIVIRLEATAAQREEAEAVLDACVERLLALAAGCP